MPRSSLQRLLRLGGTLTVLAGLGFLLLPAFVVALAAFNASALPSFPPQAWSLRWFAKAIAYQDFREGLSQRPDRHQHEFGGSRSRSEPLSRSPWTITGSLQEPIEGVLLSPLFVPHFTVGLGFLILAAQVGLVSAYALVVLCHVILVLPFVLRSVYVSLAQPGSAA